MLAGRWLECLPNLAGDDPATTHSILNPVADPRRRCRLPVSDRAVHPVPGSKRLRGDVQHAFTTEFFRLVYRPGQLLRKAIDFSTSRCRRLDTLRDVSRFDVVFIYRELFPIGPAFVERLLRGAGAPPVVFDFDDAIFLRSVSDAESLDRRAQVAAEGRDNHPPQPARDCRQRSGGLRAPVQSGGHHDSDLGRHRSVRARREPAAPVACPIVGWIGSPTTAATFGLLPVLPRRATRHPFVHAPRQRRGPAARGRGRSRWTTRPGRSTRKSSCSTPATSASIRSADDEWSKGKCGFKAISSWRAACRSSPPPSASTAKSSRTA